MDSADNPFPNKPRTIAELLPALSGILSKDAMRSLTAKKAAQPTIAVTRTSVKTVKPMTVAEIRAINQALQPRIPKKLAQGATSAKKKWNSSVKVVKTVSRTADGQIKNNPVRKVLDFQQPQRKIPKPLVNSNARMKVNEQTPKFPKPEIYPKKVQARNLVRISGICHMPETPVLLNNHMKNRLTIANKENRPTVLKKLPVTPKSSLRKQIMASRIQDTPLSNYSRNSSCDASFLRNEREIEYTEYLKALTEENTLENLSEVSPPMSTPLKNYRNVKEYFDNSSDITKNSTAAYDDTIMCFDKTSTSKENSNQEASVIVSLCDMLNKAAVSNSSTKQLSTELDYLLEFEKQTENNLKMVKNFFKTLNNFRESNLKSLYQVRKLIEVKRKVLTSKSDKDKTVIETKKLNASQITVMTPKQTQSPKIVLKSCLKSPSYKIPKKNMSSLKKKVLYKSLANTSKVTEDSPKDMALSVYMKMKEHMNFLSTPMKQGGPMDIPGTPAVTSQNLRNQLDKLYSEF